MPTLFASLPLGNKVRGGNADGGGVVGFAVFRSSPAVPTSGLLAPATRGDDRMQRSGLKSLPTRDTTPTYLVYCVYIRQTGLSQAVAAHSYADGDQRTRQSRLLALTGFFVPLVVIIIYADTRS
ncbi:hypothetical protein H6P81_009045 [Aristolochia fimbriata]|uniref:Uncharacterized protein n=1 Tax=Aristolochia fimbriata TaxID=158543 RepID=A0AAV7ELW3_ARIFI|nr:hypothetical protein H6P81_009045 [Aristolochia fimbriata]